MDIAFLAWLLKLAISSLLGPHHSHIESKRRCLLLYLLTAGEGCVAALNQSLPWGIWPCWARTIYARYKEISQPIQQTQARRRLVPVDSSLCVPLAASWREVPVLIRLHIEASDVPKWVKCKCLNQAQIVHAYDSAGPVISSASAQLECQNTKT